jgi:hypothetical protein
MEIAMSNSRVLGALAGIVTIATVLWPMLDKDPITGPPMSVGIAIIVAGAVVTLLSLAGAAQLVAALVLLVLTANLVRVEFTMHEIDNAGRVVLGVSAMLNALAILALLRARRAS